ncbi:MAG: DNA/RNA helicase domain-containing protein, partial [Actinomycetota bacterium]
AEWSVLVGLVGEGQEIHSGEEAGLEQWRDAVATHAAGAAWKVHCSPTVAGIFSGLDVTSHDELSLDTTLRSHRAEDLHQWVRLLLEGSISLAHRQAVRFQQLQYPVYLTRDLAEATAYVRRRYENNPAKRFGLLASSHAKLLPKFGVENSYIATSRMNVARWYNAAPESELSSNALRQPVTEFGCQGLELDLPILCWGEDYRWQRDAWHLTPIRRRYQQGDPRALLRNAYRVLLTRGRDGLVVYLPPDPRLDATELILLAAGVRHIPTDAELMADEAVAG